jgi:hypothetical protein
MSDYWDSLPTDSIKQCPLDRINVVYLLPSNKGGGQDHAEETRRMMRFWNKELSPQNVDFIQQLSQNSILLQRLYDGNMYS